MSTTCGLVEWDSDVLTNVRCDNPVIPGKNRCSLHWTGKWEERPGWRLLQESTFCPLYWRSWDGAVVMGDEEGGVLHLPENKRLHDGDAPNGYGDRFESVDEALEQVDRLYPVEPGPVAAGASERIVAALKKRPSLWKAVRELAVRESVFEKIYEVQPPYNQPSAEVVLQVESDGTPSWHPAVEVCPARGDGVHVFTTTAENYCSACFQEIPTRSDMVTDQWVRDMVTDQRVREAIKQGHRTRAAICAATGLPDRVVHGTVVALTLAGELQFVKGAWQQVP